MRTLGEFRTDAPITVEQYKTIDDRVKIAARRAMIGRKLMPIYGPLGFGKQSVTYDVLTELADAEVSFSWRVEGGEDLVNLARTTLNIPVIKRPFRINRRSLEASRSAGTPIDTQMAASAAYKVGKKEDDIIIQGWAPDGSNYDIQGLYQINIGDVLTGSQWTAAPEDALTDVASGVGYLMGKDIDPPYHLVVHPTQYAEMGNVGASAHTNAIVRPSVKEQLMGGDIFWSSALDDGTGFMMAAGDRGFFDLAVGVDVTTEVELLGLNEGRDLFGLVYETIVPRIWQTDAVVPFDTL